MADAVDATPLQPTATPSEDAAPVKNDVADGTKQFVMELEEYNMKQLKRGQAVIINNRNFITGKNLPTREGTDEDANKLEKTLSGLGFNVAKHKNKEISEMRTILEKASKEDYSDADCFLCAILSHGDTDVVYGTDGETVQIDQLREYFRPDKCASLTGKPKIFFIQTVYDTSDWEQISIPPSLQACRGKSYDDGVDVDSDDMAKLPRRKIPLEADTLVGHSTCRGYYSWRNEEAGSWYIQSICEVFKHPRHLTLLQLMTLVNKRVAYEYVSDTNKAKSTNKKQMPSFESTLTKDVVFHPKA